MKGAERSEKRMNNFSFLFKELFFSIAKRRKRSKKENKEEQEKKARLEKPVKCEINEDEDSFSDSVDKENVESQSQKCAKSFPAFYEDQTNILDFSLKRK